MLSLSYSWYLYLYVLARDANINFSKLLTNLEILVSKLLTHNVMQSQSVKDLLYKSGCLSEEEITNSEAAAKDTQQSQYITAVLQSKNLGTFRELI